MKKIFVYITLLLVHVVTFAQVPGTWNEYFSFRNVQQLEAVEDNVFALSENGIFIYNTTTEEIQKITKLNGLSTVGLTCFAFCDSTSSFLIGYSDGTLDILSYPNLQVKSIPTIAQKSLYASKKINKIVMHNDTAIIAAEFGVLTFSMTTKNFISTTILSEDGSYVPVKSVACSSDKIYSATTKGIFSASLNSANLSDYTTWSKLTDIPYENDTISHIAVLNDVVYYVHKNTADAQKDSIFKIVNGKAEAFKTQVGQIQSVRNTNKTLCVVGIANAKIYNKLENPIAESIPTPTIDYFTDIIKMTDNSIWVSTRSNGIFSPTDNNSVSPNGPLSNSIANMQYINGKLYMVAGAITLWQMASFNMKTTNWNGTTHWNGHNNWHCSNSIAVCVDNATDKYYYACYGTGIVEGTDSWWYDTIYTTDNSKIQNKKGESFSSIYDVKLDSKGNLWAVNYDAKEPLVVKTKDGEWYAYSIDSKMFKNIYVDSRDYKWIVGTSYLSVFSGNGTFENTSDDLFVKIPLTDHEGTIASRTTCLTEDLDGEIWIGTNQGIAVHSSPSRVFKDRQSISRIKIEIDGEVGYLLSSENITCIAVDGANRKWIGTENSGVFLISENGTEQLENFTKSNSPLPTNNITSIAIDHLSGEVYIGTTEGLVSYVGDATIGNAQMTEIKIFPNPVRESYEGDIFIQGLVSDANVKITDITGNLVRTVTANGGTATWDGRNLYGDRVQTGVYLIYISDETATYTTVKKILFIN